jgi:ParB-like chromosome segregation protein Spo0J
MNPIKVKISEVKSNQNNPRIIKDDKFQKLVKSIKEFPEMLNIRPIVVNADMVVLGGNMRLKACKEAGLKEVAIIKAEDLTEDQQKQFIIKDNVGFGEWDWEDLANNWDAEQLTDWGLDIPNFMEMPSEDELTEENKNKPPTIKITFENPEQLQAAEIDIIELIDRKYPKAFFSVSAGEI